MDIFGESLNIVIPAVLLALGFAWGRMAENAHYRSIRERERRYLAVPIVTLDTVDDSREVVDARLVTGCVVISVDYYKRFLSAFRMLFGGELSSYSPLLDRGRREALLRMRESAPKADAFMNCRMETSTITKGKGKSTAGVEVLVYSTAITYGK